MIEFPDEILKQMALAIREINNNGGFGELVIVIRKGNPEFVNHTIVKRFNQPKKDKNNGRT